MKIGSEGVRIAILWGSMIGGVCDVRERRE